MPDASLMGHCPACGAPRPDASTCEEDFHQMLYWEGDNPANAVVHHLMVLSYYLQHPHLYSPEGLHNAMILLQRFVAQGHSPHQVRRDSQQDVDSGNRTWKVTARPGEEGTYIHPVQWTMTGADVIAAGAPHYRERVSAWASSIYDSLKESGNLPTL